MKDLYTHIIESLSTQVPQTVHSAIKQGVKNGILEYYKQYSSFDFATTKGTNTDSYKITCATESVLEFMKIAFPNKKVYTSQEICVIFLFAIKNQTSKGYCGTTNLQKCEKIKEQVERLRCAVVAPDNDAAMLLEKCLSTIGFDTSKGSGRKGEQAESKYVYLQTKSDSELNYAKEVSDLYDVCQELYNKPKI